MADNLVKYILSVDTQGAVVGLDKVESGAKKTGKELDKTKDKGKKAGADLKKSFKAIGGAALAAGAAAAAAAMGVFKFVGAMKKFTTEAVDMINDLGDIGNRSGIAADTIGALKAAFHASGQEAGAVNSTLDVVAKKFGALSRGSKKAEKSFAKYGVAVRDVEGHLRSNNDVLLDAMHVIEHLADTSQRSRAAVELFGVGGQQLSQALGAGNFDEFLGFVNEFGAVAGPQAAKSAALVQDSISLSNIAFEGFREELVLSLGLMKTFQRVLNAQMAIFAGLSKVVKHTAHLVHDVIASFGELFSAITDLFSSFNTEAEKTNKEVNILADVFFSLQGIIIASVITPIQLLIFKIGDLVINLEFAIATFAEFFNMGDVFEPLISSLGRLKEAIFSTLESLSALKISFSPLTEEGQETRDVFVEGINKAFERFNKIVAGSKSRMKGFIEEQEELIETTEEATKEIDRMAAAASSLNSVLNKLGVPRSLQFGGFKEITAQVDDFSHALFMLGEQGKFGGQSKRKGDISNLDLMAQNVATAINVAAPQIGAAIAITAGLIQLAEKFGKMGDSIDEIKSELTKSVQERAEVIERGLHVLPKILNDVLPHIVQILADAIIFGFAKIIAENINMLLTGLRQVLTREGRQERRKERQEGITLGDRFGEFFRRMGVLGDIAFEGMRAGGRIPSARSGLNFTGQNAGLALLHKNEFVVPESGQAPQSVKRAMGGMGGSVNIVVNAQVVEQNAVDELVRQIERRFRTFGQSTSPLFGS